MIGVDLAEGLSYSAVPVSQGESVVRQCLACLGEDPDREGLVETPSRVVRSWATLFGGYKQDPASVLKTFTDGACDEMVVLTDCPFISHCEHHMLPFFGTAHIAYLPNKRVVGVSKLVRLLEVYSRRLQIQERLSAQIVDALMTYLQPLGAGCVLEAQHLCMVARGVQKPGAKLITSALRGVFLDKPGVKEEFMTWVRR